MMGWQVAEALAELAASIAAGTSIQDTLTTAVDAAARIFGSDVHCAIALPDEDGLLRVVAWNDEATQRIANFKFKPGEGVNGRAFSEGRLVRVDDLKQPDGPHRQDIRDASSSRSLVSAPLVFQQRILGVLTTASARPAAFDERHEQVLTAVARHVALALAAAEARERAQAEATQKAAIIAQMADGVVVCDARRRVVEANAAAS